MELQDYVRIVRKRWRIITVTLLAALAVAGALTVLTPKTYQATAKIFVSTGSGNSSATDLAQGSAFAQKQMTTYADVMTSNLVLDPVKRQLKLPATEDLTKVVTVSVPADTVLLQVQAADRDPQYATRVSNAVARQFTKTVVDLQAGTLVKANIVQSATVPDEPISPRPLRNMGLGAALGLLLGLALAMVRDLLDSRVKEEGDLARVTDRPVIGTVHFDSTAKKQPLITQTDLHGPRAEAFRTLRTNLQFVDAASHPRKIVVTSTLPGEGKTTTAANLAITLGASGATVCAVEADLRRPRLLEYMGMEGSVGLTTVLIGGAELDDVLQPLTKNVTVLGAGPIPPNPSELLGSQPMRTVVEHLASRFDYVIFDVPPLLPVTDAAVVSTMADGAVLVVGSGLVKRDAVTKSLERLGAVNAAVLGVVLNRVPVRGLSAYSYKSGYSYQGETRPDLGSQVDVIPAAPRQIDVTDHAAAVSAGSAPGGVHAAEPDGGVAKRIDVIDAPQTALETMGATTAPAESRASDSAKPADATVSPTRPRRMLSELLRR